MPRFDLEDLVDSVVNMLQNKLQAQIDAVEAEKVAAGKTATGIDQPANAIPANAYFKLAWNDQALNQKIGVGVFVRELQEDGNGPDTRVTYTLDVGIVLAGTQNDPLATAKLLRYMRALRQTFETNYTRITGFTKETLKSEGPVAFTTDVDSAEEYKIAGVTFQVVLG